MSLDLQATCMISQWVLWCTSCQHNRPRRQSAFG